MVGAFLRGGYVTVPRCWPRKVSPLLLHLTEPLSPSLLSRLRLSVLLGTSVYLLLYEVFFTACWSPHSDLPLPSPHERPPSSLSRRFFLYGLPSTLPSPSSLPLPRRPFVARIRCRPLRGFKRPDTLVHRWYHRSWLQPLSFYPSPTRGRR